MLIDDLTPDEFLQQYLLQKADLLKKYIVWVTTVFNQRVKMFIKLIVMTKKTTQG